jgi:hypothetical protein
MQLVVGAPVRRREWIADKWMDHVAWATIEAGIHDADVTLVFVAHPEDPSIPALRKTANLYGFETLFLREIKPDLFLSLDSDILINDKALRSMIRLLETARSRKDRPVAASHCVYMSREGIRYPNYAMLTDSGRMRRDFVPGDLTAVHVLMAAKLMTPRAYNVDYEYDRRGEDIGWSNAVRQRGMHLAWTGKVTSKHCMEVEDLHRVDARCGY